MAVLTEAKIRSLLKDTDLKNTKVLETPKGTIVTPSGKGYLSEQRIRLKFVDETRKTEAKKKDVREDTVESHYQYTTIYGGFLDKKPEHMTSLNGDMLVFKDDKRIIFRGKLDSLQSIILETQSIFYRHKQTILIDELQEILDFVRRISRSEVLDEKLDDFSLQNMNPQEMREISHHPEKYMGIDFFEVHYTMGEVMVQLNKLRTEIRETEIAAYEAYKWMNGNPEREDIIFALNRLSSLIWIMMCKYQADHYKT